MWFDYLLKQWPTQLPSGHKYPTYLSTQFLVTHPNYLRKQILVIHPTSRRTWLLVNHPTSLRIQWSLVFHPTTLKTKLLTTYLRTQMLVSHPLSLRTQTIRALHNDSGSVKITWVNRWYILSLELGRLGKSQIERRDIGRWATHVPAQLKHTRDCKLWKQCSYGGWICAHALKQAGAFIVRFSKNTNKSQEHTTGPAGRINTL